MTASEQPDPTATSTNDAAVETATATPPVRQESGGWTGLLSAPGGPALMITGLLARLSTGMTPLAVFMVVLLGRGDAIEAALVSIAHLIGLAAIGRTHGRLLDRLGIGLVISVGGLVCAGSLYALSELTRSSWLIALVGLGLLSGLSRPQVTSCTRAIWSSLELSPGARKAAASWERTVQTAVIVGGCLIAYATVVTSGTQNLLVVTALVGLAGQYSLLLLPATWRWRSRRRTRAPIKVVASSPSLRVLLIAVVFSSAAGGALLVGLVAYGFYNFSLGTAPLAFACLGAGSLIGNLLYRAIKPAMGLDRQLSWLLFLEALGLALIAFTPSVNMLYLIAVIAGIAGGPVMAATYSLAAQVAPDHGYSETFSWVAAWTLIGAALGQAAGTEMLVRSDPSNQNGPINTFTLAYGIAMTGALLAVLILRRTRRPPRDIPAVGMAPM